MPRHHFSPQELLLQTLRPETSRERALLALPELQEGLHWGEPRFGHPEGKVFLHVREVLDNIERISLLEPRVREQLRLVAFAHDAFKFCEDRGQPRDWSRHHGILARQFMENFTDDSLVLDIIELHDEAYYVWRDFRQNRAPARSLDALLARVEYCLQPYYLFFKCDTQTGDKTQAPWRWFEGAVLGVETIGVREMAQE